MEDLQQQNLVITAAMQAKDDEFNRRMERMEAMMVVPGLPVDRVGTKDNGFCFTRSTDVRVARLFADGITTVEVQWNAWVYRRR